MYSLPSRSRNLLPLASFHEDRPGIVSAVVAGDTERNALEILLVSFGGLRRAPLEGGEFFLQIGIHRIAPGKLRPALIGQAGH